MKKTPNRVLLLSALLTLHLLSGCTGIAPEWYDLEKEPLADPTQGLTKDDYLQLPYTGDPKETIAKGAVEPSIPDLAPILSAPPIPKLGQTKLVSLAVTDDVPLKDVLLELSRLADVDMQIDANIQGGITFRATQRPFNEVIERICEFAGLRYKMKDGVLAIERDTPYVEMYTLDFLNLQRDTTNTMSLSTNVLSASDGDKGSLQSGSTTSIKSDIKDDFWIKFSASITQILAFTPSSHKSDFNVLPDAASSNENSQAPSRGVPEAGVGSEKPTMEKMQAVAAAPVAAPAAAGAGGAQAAAFTMNQQAATLTVMATERQHRLIREFINRVTYNASAQVLIEAKILEVTLNEQYQTGIDWTRLGSESINFSRAKYGGLSDGLGAGTLAINKGVITGLNINLQGVVDMMQRFGATRTLSSPRLHAINNQQAVLTFAKNEVYFDLDIDKEEKEATPTSPAKITFKITTEIKTVPIGIILSMLPSVNQESGEITLNIRPTLSRVVDRVTDPFISLAKALDPAFADLDVENKIPVVEVRELDSIMKAKSGQVMVIGGLMEDKATNIETGIPGAKDIPIFGNLFKGSDRSRQTTELVILIRPVLVGADGGVVPADKKLFDKFTRDTRPMELK